MAKRSVARKTKPKAKLTTRKNTQKGNPRAGKRFTTTVNKKGQRIHRYKGKGGKVQDVVVASKSQRSAQAKKQKRKGKGAGGGRFTK